MRGVASDGAQLVGRQSTMVGDPRKLASRARGVTAGERGRESTNETKDERRDSELRTFRTKLEDQARWSLMAAPDAAKRFLADDQIRSRLALGCLGTSDMPYCYFRWWLARVEPAECGQSAGPNGLMRRRRHVLDHPRDQPALCRCRSSSADPRDRRHAWWAVAWLGDSRGHQRCGRRIGNVGKRSKRSCSSLPCSCQRLPDAAR